MAEVALVAGVSATTVSHVINGTRKVAPQTEAQVRAALASTGYRHNLTARALATQSTDTIGVAMSVVTNPYFADLVRDIERRLRRAGFTMVLTDTNDDPEVENEVLDRLLSRQVSGLIVSPLEGHQGLIASFQALLDEHFPIVFLDRRSPQRADQVFSECTRPIAELTAHLAALGHRRVAYVQGALTSMSSVDRLAGYQRAVVELGLDADPELVIAGESDEGITEQRILNHLRGSQPATAFVVSNNQMTIATMRAIRQCGLSVPNDLALVGYDDFEWADLFAPRLTAMAQDAARLAAATVDLLLARIEKPTRRPRTVVVPTTFHHRDSCGCR
ncbi:MAG: LacI family transcriptional regulator [Actinomycetia bacterium]|nr:LacI family transcriptional regulator [Actinomycetes bacterium]